jgi:hypothetical protein
MASTRVAARVISRRADGIVWSGGAPLGSPHRIAAGFVWRDAKSLPAAAGDASLASFRKNRAPSPSVRSYRRRRSCGIGSSSTRPRGRTHGERTCGSGGTSRTGAWQVNQGAATTCEQVVEQVKDMRRIALHDMGVAL